jgi:putative hydrolase of the HAD superfamily
VTSRRRRSIRSWSRRELLGHPVELIDGVDETVTELAEHHQLVLITKGDLLHQETKLAASGLGERFWRIEIVSEKDVATYQRILSRHEIAVDDFVMVGNSVRSDILPVLEIGARCTCPTRSREMEHVAIDDDDNVPTISTLRARRPSPTGATCRPSEVEVAAYDPCRSTSRGPASSAPLLPAGPA